MECPYGHKKLPQDSASCFLSVKEISPVPLKQKNKSNLKRNPRENSGLK